MPRKITNSFIANKLEEMGLFLEMENVPFKPQAYFDAAQTIRNLEDAACDIYKKGGQKALDELPGVGASISEKIGTLCKIGKLPEHQKLYKKYPIDIRGITAIEGIGTKMAKKLFELAQIKSVASLKTAIQKGKLEKIPGFGKKTSENILKSITFLKSSEGRFALGSIYPEIQKIVQTLKQTPGTKTIEIAGSVRRMKETIGDLDLIAVTDKPKLLSEALTHIPRVKMIAAHGPSKTMVRLDTGLDIDLRIVKAESLGAALLYFTGSRDHTIELRRIAQKMNLTLNEYGLYTKGKLKKLLAGKTEKSIYEALKLQYIPPELREMQGELEAAGAKKLPKLINYSDLKGDLQVQTSWTDAGNTIEEMALAARAAGLEYIAITDHTEGLAIARGNSPARLKKQMKEIDRLNKKFNGKPYILKGAEVNITKDGSLDMPDNILIELDVVGISVHSGFKMSKEEMTARICKAMHNPHVDILFHPTGRHINRRPAYELDIEEVIRVAKKTGTVLEIDAAPRRLDLKDNYIKKAVEAKVKLSIDSDAHATEHFAYLKYGIGQARRGWAKKTDLINTYPLKKMLSFLKNM